ncbi:hypothetical protein SY85_09715 [Flavisolibacter tropicus]|uniref:Uncharacterized protein n=1 Tax=Flavisolibacter tropicus TaxID=1492898 RepID=A0A172TUD9_9BACT|nr:hypothetical protein SY85_09715 [Flavisolibacter tropicus]
MSWAALVSLDSSLLGALLALFIIFFLHDLRMYIEVALEDGRRSSECGRQVEGFFCAVGTDLPTEEVQKRYRLGTGEVQETREILQKENFEGGVS